MQLGTDGVIEAMNGHEAARMRDRTVNPHMLFSAILRRTGQQSFFFPVRMHMKQHGLPNASHVFWSQGHAFFLKIMF